MKKKSESKPRQTIVEASSSGKEMRVDSLYIDPLSGRVQFFNRGLSVFPNEVTIETSYKRPTKKKVLNKTIGNPLAIFANVNRQLEDFKEIYAVDTNTKELNGIHVSITGVVSGNNSSVALPDHTCIFYRPIACLEFWNIKGKPENLGWVETISAIMRNPKYNPRARIALVVDSDLGNMEFYNRREKPIFANFILPENFKLIYASSDSGNENIANKMLRLADQEATNTLKKAKHLVSKELLKPSSHPYFEYFKFWQK